MEEKLTTQDAVRMIRWCGVSIVTLALVLGLIFGLIGCTSTLLIEREDAQPEFRYYVRVVNLETYEILERYWGFSEPAYIFFPNTEELFIWWVGLDGKEVIVPASANVGLSYSKIPNRLWVFPALPKMGQ